MTDFPVDGALADASAGARARAVRTPALAGVRRAGTTAAGATEALWQRVGAPALALCLRPFRAIAPLGWGLIVAGGIALALWLAFDWAEFAAASAACAIALIAGVPFLFGRAQFRVRVELASPRVTVGEPAVGRVIVRNIAKRASGATRIEMPVGRARASFRMPRLAASTEHDELFTIPTQRRAVLRLGPVSSVRSDPLGALRREVRWTEPTELYVHPRVVRLAAETTGFLRDLEGLPTRDLADDDVSFHALREYVPGDDLRHVHWKATARTQRLMIRQFEQTRRSHTVIVLSCRLDDYAHADEFELAVSMAGSVGLGALHDGRAVTLLHGGRALHAVTAGQLLDHLSGVELDEQAPTLDALGRGIAQAAASASVIVFVTGAPTEASVIRTAALRAPLAARSVCLRAVLGGALGRRIIGDVAMVSVPELPALRAAMRAVAA